ncbi:MAG TPA: hypothetical protein DCS67_00690 [Clostridiales bacterium UBA8960]|nr:hypothetical protein [Clostridiales bacterium UBA8960]
MIHKLLPLILAILLILTGCMSGEGYQDYMDALEKTENITKGTSKVDVQIKNRFNEDLGPIDIPETISVIIESRFDYSKSQSISDIYYLGNSLGMDLKLYQKDKDALYLKVPFMSGLYAISESQVNMMSEPADVQAFMKNVGKEWNAMLMSENIFVGEKTIVRNEDGEVKATKFTVKPTSEQLETFTETLRKVILANQVQLLHYFKEWPIAQMDVDLTESEFEKIVNAVFSSMKITRYEEVAYMDLDGYIIDEQIEIGLEYISKNGFTNLFESQTIRIHTTHWNIEKNQTLDFSVLDQLEILPIEKLMEWSVTQ